ELGGTVNEASLDGTNPRSIVTTGVNQPLMMAVATSAPPALAFTPAPFGYGKVGTGQAVSHTFTLANTGGQATRPPTPTGPRPARAPGPAASPAPGATATAPGRAAATPARAPGRSPPASIPPSPATLTTASVNPAVTATDALTGTGVLRPRFLYWTNSPMT